MSDLELLTEDEIRAIVGKALSDRMLEHLLELGTTSIEIVHERHVEMPSRSMIVARYRTQGWLDKERARLGFQARFAARGGRTCAIIAVRDAAANPDFVFRGVAVCSDLDSFNKVRGVQIALGRALKKARNL